MNTLERLRTDPLPAIHPMPEYLASGQRAKWYEDSDLKAGRCEILLKRGPFLDGFFRLAEDASLKSHDDGPAHGH